MLSIFDVTNWAAQTDYNLYDIYRYNGFYYYAIKKHNSGIAFNANYSDGTITYSGKTKPYFFWKCSYNLESPIKPTVKISQFGDGYRQITPDGINNTLLTFNLTFDKRTDAETRAILHFLYNRKGSESFVYFPPFPYNTNKLFKCEQYTHTTVFSNNHTITCVLNESPL